MTEVETIIRSSRANLEHIGHLRKAVTAELAQSPFDRPQGPGVSIERALIALIDDCWRWRASPQLVAVVTELETLARSFRPGGRVRALLRLSPEAVAALLRQAPGGSGVVFPGFVRNGEIEIADDPLRVVAALTDREADNARLFGRMQAQAPVSGPVDALAIFAKPEPTRERLLSLFAGTNAPGRGHLAALKQHLDEEGRAVVAACATRGPQFICAPRFTCGTSAQIIGAARLWKCGYRLHRSLGWRYL